MTREVMTIGPDATLDTAIRLLLAKRISGLPVIDEQNELIGIISEKDIFPFAFSGKLDRVTVREAMSIDVKAFSEQTGINEIASVISDGGIRRVPVVRNKRVVGIISRRDIMSNL